MSNFTITAGQIVDSVIQDGQVQTTNRTALLDYVNRVSLRMLRESQWSFLKSRPLKFITDLGGVKYWIGSGPPPSGAIDTGLQLTNVASVIPESVFDVTNAIQLAEVSQTTLNKASFKFLDGSYKLGTPRNYYFEYGSEGILNVLPPSIGDNEYQPVPLPPQCSYVTGGGLPRRVYAVAITYVDSFSNEGAPCVSNTIINVPANKLLVVHSPDPDVYSSTTVSYNGWNVYVGIHTGTGADSSISLQNAVPLANGATFTEPITGISSTLTPATGVGITDASGTLWTLGVSPTGDLTSDVVPVSQPGTVFLQDVNGNLWLLGVNVQGLLFTQNLNTVPATSPLPVYIGDTASNVWQVNVTPEGMLTTTFEGSSSGFAVPGRLAPKTSNLVPLLGYVIQFQYLQQRLAIVDATSLLQIPYQYKDVVVAGVNYYANLYTAKADDENVKVMVWKKEFMDGLAQMRRDLRINSRTVDFLSPDPSSQRSQGVDWNIALYE